MYVVFQNGNKQYLVKQGDTIKIEKINYYINDIIFFKKIILVYKKNNILIGNPYIKNIKIIAKILKHEKQKKINIIKFKRRKHYKKKIGHRQILTKINITNIFFKKENI